MLSLRDPGTGIFAANNFASTGVILSLSRLRRRDVALVGFDDLPLAEMLEPGLTVIAQDPAAIGRAAAELLIARLDGNRSKASTVVIRTWLIARGSGEL